MTANKVSKRVMKLKGAMNLVYSGLLLRYTRWNTRRLKEVHKKMSVDRLHVGCGDILLDGWLNIRFEHREEYGRTKSFNGRLLLNYNLLSEWPFDEGSIRFIAGSHFIEHLDLNHGMAFTKECHRVLKQGGFFGSAVRTWRYTRRIMSAGTKVFLTMS